MSHQGGELAGVRLLAWGAAIVVGVAGIALASWFILRSPGGRAQAVAQHVREIQLPRAAEEIPCSATSGTRPPLVLLALGQSNAGNHGERRMHSSTGTVWFAGRCYAITDPIAGGTGNGGSIWSRLASDLGAEIAPRKLQLIVLAVDSSSIEDWIGHGPLNDRLTQLLADLRTHRIEVSTVLWQQGEEDARRHVPRERDAASLAMLIENLRKGGIAAAPVYLARSTRCANAGSPDIREAIAVVAAQQTNVRVGPDTDVLGRALRIDGCHFNVQGLERAARLWEEALRADGVLARSARASEQVEPVSQ